MIEKTSNGHRFKAYRDTDLCMICNEYKSNHIGEEMKTEKTDKPGVPMINVNGQNLSLSEVVFQALTCTEDLTRESIIHTLSNIKLFDKKQRDYGSRNIARFGEQGVLVRSSDKFERLNTLLKNPPKYVVDSANAEDAKFLLEVAEQKAAGTVVKMKKSQWNDNLRPIPKNEPIEDTWQDISNYATIALLVRKGVWPKY